MANIYNSNSDDNKTITTNDHELNDFSLAIYGDIYDPDEHIFTSVQPLEEYMILTESNDDFAWYINYPIYKRELIKPGEYLHDNITGTCYTEDFSNTKFYLLDTDKPDYIEYLYRVFDDKYNKLQTPIKIVNDENLEIRHGLLDWMV